jgi:DNA polymerase-3 subunit gamma/tau
MTLLRMISFMHPHRQERPAGAAAPGRPEPRAGSARDAQPAVAQPAPRAAAPESRAAAAESSAAPAAPRPQAAFDGDWAGLVERLKLTGMAGMVARHGELAAYENNHVELVVPEAHRVYAEKAYQDKLRAELQQHFGPGLRLTVKVGPTAGKSVAAARSRDMEQRQASAAEAIEEDPFVRDLVRDLGAEVVSSSIRPTEDPGGSTSEKR